jgi:hypothetical protein
MGNAIAYHDKRISFGTKDVRQAEDWIAPKSGINKMP